MASDYIMEMRKLIGHTPLLTVGCGVLVENEDGALLLQKRTDDNTWGTPGGGMNLGETFMETAVREVSEETGLHVSGLSLYGIYSGQHCIIEYPNNDICFGAIIIFHTKIYSGETMIDNKESLDLRFFSRENLPENINQVSSKWIEHWRKNIVPIIVD